MNNVQAWLRSMKVSWTTCWADSTPQYTLNPIPGTDCFSHRKAMHLVIIPCHLRLNDLSCLSLHRPFFLYFSLCPPSSGRHPFQLPFLEPGPARWLVQTYCCPSGIYWHSSPRDWSCRPRTRASLHLRDAVLSAARMVSDHFPRVSLRSAFSYNQRHIATICIF